MESGLSQRAHSHRMHRLALVLLILLPGHAFGRDESLWHNPGPVDTLDFWWGPGGRDKAPAPPYRFVKEDLSGSKAKVNLIDAHGRHWNAKFGYEVPGGMFWRADDVGGGLFH